MREIIKRQMTLGEADIGAIEISTKARDDIPRLLRGLQHIYTTEGLGEEVFVTASEAVLQRADDSGPGGVDTERPGISEWEMLVLGVLRLGLSADYERVTELANQAGERLRSIGRKRTTTRVSTFSDAGDMTVD